jgi:hypothetical protein
MRKGIPDDILTDVRTHAEQAAAALDLARVRRGEAGDPLCVRVRVLGGARRDIGLERVGWLTPYAAEMIVEDAIHAGRGACLEVTVPADAAAGDLDCVQRHFARLKRRGVGISVRCADGTAGAAGDLPSAPVS